jgi:general secretion pathway protein G
MSSELWATGRGRTFGRFQQPARYDCAEIVPLLNSGKLPLNSQLRIRNCSGFTLIELLVVISLISILAAMGMVQYKNQVRRTQESVLKTDLFHMRDAIDQYYADKGKYPSSLDALVSDGYLRKIPDDPITLSASTWQTVPAEADPANPSGEPGIYDVKSGAPGTALDGSTYADW